MPMIKDMWHKTYGYGPVVFDFRSLYLINFWSARLELPDELASNLAKEVWRNEPKSPWHEGNSSEVCWVAQHVRRDISDWTDCCRCGGSVCESQPTSERFPILITIECSILIHWMPNFDFHWMPYIVNYGITGQESHRSGIAPAEVVAWLMW